METVPGTTEAQSAFRRVSPEVVVTWPGLPDAAFCPVAAPVAAPVAKKVAAPVAKPQVARIPIGGIPAGDGSTAMPKMLPRTGPAYPTWAIGVFALGCFALGGLMLLLGNRPAKPLPVRKDAGAISLHALGRDAAVVAACLVVSAGTFLAIARATHQPVTTLVQAVFTPTAEQADPWGSPVQDRGRQMTSDEWGVVVPGQAYMGFLETDGVAKLRQVGPPAVAVPGCPFTNVGQDFPLGLGAACPVPAVLSGADLPGGTVIRVHTAAGTNENCTHTTGYGYSTDGQLAIGDGWKCAR
jgi:hypothetical protein